MILWAELFIGFLILFTVTMTVLVGFCLVLQFLSSLQEIFFEK